MAYTKQTWVDGEAGGTPLSAARLNYLETGVDTAHDTADAAETPAGAQAKVDAHASATGTHGVSGALVGTTDAQALTNKDLSGASNTFPAGMKVKARAKAAQSAAASIATATTTVLTLDNELYDSDNLHSNTTNPDRITLNKIGAWLVIGQVSISGSSTGRRVALVFLNGTTQVARGNVFPTSTIEAAAQAVGVIDVTATTDYVDLRAYQDSGGSLDTIPGNTHLTAIFIGE